MDGQFLQAGDGGGQLGRQLGARRQECAVASKEGTEGWGGQQGGMEE